MTRIVEPKVIQCPLCDGYLLRTRLASFNTYGVRYWTDGYTSGGISLYHSALMLCAHCHARFWDNDAKEHGILPKQPQAIGRFSAWYEKVTGDKDGVLSAIEYWNQIPIAIKTAPHSVLAQSSDWLQEFAHISQLSDERAIMVRRHVWWAGNDHHRARSDGVAFRPKAAISEAVANQNLLELLELHESEKIEEPYEKSELLRQLSRFDECLTLIEIMPHNEWNLKRILQVKKFAMSGNPTVQEIPELYQW